LSNYLAAYYGGYAVYDLGGEGGGEEEEDQERG